MRYKAITGMVQTVFLTGLLILAFSIQPINATTKNLLDFDPNTIYVFSGGKPDAETITVLNQLKADVAYRVFFTYGENLQQVETRWSNYHPFIETCNQGGIKVGAIISAGILEPENFNSTFVEDVATRDASGNVILLYQPNVGNYYHHGCLNNEKWRAHLLGVAQFTVDFGINVIEFDEATSHWWWPGECYCDPCTTQFRDFLNEKYSAEELIDKFNITDIETFNYRDYLAARNLTESDEWTRLWSHPLGHEYYIFELISLTNHFDELASAVKSYAKNQDTEVMICANQFELKNVDVPITKSVDLLSIGTSLKVWARMHDGSVVERFGPPHYTAAPFILFGRALNSSKHSVMFIDTDYVGVTEEMVKVLIADALSFGGFYNLPHYSGTVGAHAGPGPLEGFKEYAFFMDGHRDLFHNLTSLSRVGLLFPYETLLWTSPPDYPPWVYGACQVLIDAHILHDVVFTGDGNVMPNQLQLNDVKKYDVLFLPHINFMSNATVKLLKQYLAGGGKLVMTGYNAIWDEMGLEQPGRLDSIVGHENVSNLNQLDWAAYWAYVETKNANIRETITQHINNFTRPVLETNASYLVAVNSFTQPDSDQFIIELANYDYSNETDTIHPHNDILIKVKIPDWFSPVNMELTLLSPDTEPEELKLPFVISNGDLEFVVPQLKVYSVIVASHAPPRVGGVYLPVNKLELLAPYIGLAILLAVAVATVGYVKKRKRHTETSS